MNDDALLAGHSTWREVIEAHGVTPVGGLPMPDADEDDLEDLPLPEEEAVEQWVALARHMPNQPLERVELGRRDVDLAHDWGVAGASFGDPKAFLTFLADCKKTYQAPLRSTAAPDVVFTKEQQAVLHILDMQIAAELHPDRVVEPPRRVIVQGKAGCGKSTIIKAMTAKLEASLGSNSYRLLAPTGFSALNIQAETIHRGLAIPVPDTDFSPLDGERMKKFQTEMKSVRFLIVDEYSMIGLSLLGMMHAR